MQGVADSTSPLILRFASRAVTRRGRVGLLAAPRVHAARGETEEGGQRLTSEAAGRLSSRRRTSPQGKSSSTKALSSFVGSLSALDFLLNCRESPWQTKSNSATQSTLEHMLCLPRLPREAMRKERKEI